MNSRLEISDFHIGKKLISLGSPPYLLAEMACAHDGKLHLAKQMVNDAADAGFDGIQFQLFSTCNMMTPHHRFYNKLSDLEISYSGWAEVCALAKERQLDVFIDPLSPDALMEMQNLGPNAIKLHSADLSNPEMLNGLADFRLPLLLGVGGSTIGEIECALSLLSDRGLEDVLIMHGFQGYPTAIDDTNLSRIPYLQDKLKLHVGYQDHIDGEDELGLMLPAIAAGMGAVLLEKHITDDRSRRGTDFEAALDLEGQKRFINITRNAFRARGVSQLDFLSGAELQYRKTFKKSLVAVRDLVVGEDVDISMIKFMRGEVIGFAPTELSLVIGKKVARAIKQFDVIQAKDLSD